MTIVYWYETAPFPMLGLMTLLPLLAAALMLTGKMRFLAPTAGLVVSGINVLLGLGLLWLYDLSQPGIHLAESFSFAGLSYTAGVDGSNILFLPLVTVLSFLVHIYNRLTPYTKDHRFIACLLLLEGIFIGAFAALNLMQFWLWCLLELGPVFWLTTHAGTGIDSSRAAMLLLRY